jgi:eukaryotic-like serine/threonine-protein kinase
VTQSIGTPLYMAPEQFNPRAQLTGAADLYALAMVAFKMLVGRAYWSEEAKGGNVFALANVAIQGPKEPASMRAAAHGVALPPAFDAWFARATWPDPAGRFPTGVEMAAALARAFDLPGPRAPLTTGVGSEAGSGGFGAPAVFHFAASPTPAPSAPLGVALTLGLPNVTCPTPIPTSASAPSLPTSIAAPATTKPTTPPPKPERGPSHAAAVAVALGTLGVVVTATWLLAHARSVTMGDPPRVPQTPPVNVAPAQPAAASLPSPVPVTAAPAPPEDTAAPSASLSAPASDPPPAASSAAPPAPAATATAHPAAQAPASKKRKYTRE